MIETYDDKEMTMLTVKYSIRRQMIAVYTTMNSADADLFAKGMCPNTNVKKRTLLIGVLCLQGLRSSSSKPTPLQLYKSGMEAMHFAALLDHIVTSNSLLGI